MEQALPYLTLALVSLAALLALVQLVIGRRPAELSPELASRLMGVERQMEQLVRTLPDEFRVVREEWRSQQAAAAGQLDARLRALDTQLAHFAQGQTTQLDAMRKEAADGRDRLEEAVQRNANAFASVQTDRLRETKQAMDALSERLVGAQRDSRDAQRQGLEAVAAKVEALLADNAARQEQLRETVAGSLEKVREDNSAKLEKMRATVEEKLQGTLEKRLGESFQMVSDRLEQVHKGLGEMQTLATGVGDLKRLMGNVKARGGWGEAQLEMLLQDILTPDQYSANVRIRPDSPEIVEFAVKLPGKGDDNVPLWLPIDAKLPREDYDRLLQAQDQGRTEDVEQAALALEKFIRQQARIICEKYVHPPYSTDFAVLHLPTEGLFAEVIRRPGLVSELQNSHRVMVTGPTTLAALLTSLQMGFRTLAIEKRSSEVWQILAAAKAEFQKYGDVWEKLGKQLDTAKRTVDEAGKRTRAVSRRLRDVDTLTVDEDKPLLRAFAADDDGDGDGDEAEAEAAR